MPNPSVRAAAEGLPKINTPEIPAERPHFGAVLSFVSRRQPDGSGFDYWAVETTGSYGRDCELGRKLGEEFMSYIGESPTNGNATLLADIALGIRNQPSERFGKGIVIGFMRRVNDYAMSVARLRHKMMTEDTPKWTDLAAAYSAARERLDATLEDEGPGFKEAEAEFLGSVQAIFDYRPTTMAEVAHMATVVNEITSGDDGLSNDEFRRFLRSLGAAVEGGAA